MEAAMNALSEELLTIQGDGDYARAKELTDRLGVIKPELAEDLKKLEAAKIPIDVRFKQGLDVLGLQAP
jgi:Mn-dependent DtxR family transcriptional regulator